MGGELRGCGGGRGRGEPGPAEKLKVVQSCVRMFCRGEAIAGGGDERGTKD